MGKATILSEAGAGLYSVRIERDMARADQTLSRITQEITDLDAKILVAAGDLAAIQSEIDSIHSELNSAINSGQEPDQLFQIVEKLSSPTKAMVKARNKKNALSAERLSRVKKKQFIENNQPDLTPLSVWCADFSEGLTGEVGTIEVNGTLEAAPIIFPNVIEGSSHDVARDRQIQPIVSSGAPAVYFNQAIFPAWQKWRPTYRAGTITSITGDYCDLLLDVSTSAQDLDINQAQILSGVAIEYMEDNGSVFEVGDRVIVKFTNQDFTQPKVIGFESNPKPEGYLYLMQDTFYNGAQTVDIYRHKLDGSDQTLIMGGAQAETYSRDLKRVGNNLYFFALHNGSYRIMKVDIQSGSRFTIASNVPYLYAVNSEFLYHQPLDWQSAVNRTITKKDRLNGAVLGSFEATVPNVALADSSRPEFWIDANDQYVYWSMPDDLSGSATLYYCRSDLDGNNQENLATWPLQGMPSNGGDGSWRGAHLTSDRIYVPNGYYGYLGENNPQQVAVPVQCYVYDLDFNLITSFGVLPYGVGFNSNNTLCKGFSANDYGCCWIEDDKAGGVYLHYWARKVVRNELGEIISEQFIKKDTVKTNLNATYIGISGGIAV